jgi:poly[(R)-3-hydroxyalkanoate] polymerase subunit PhaC
MPAGDCTTGYPMDAPARPLFSHSYARDDFSFSTPSRIAYEGGKLRLRHYAPVEPARSTPILFVYALTKRAFILDLAPGRSVVESLARQGFHVYLTDWIAPASSDSSRGLDAYVNEDLLNAVHVIAAERETSQVSIIGYCLGALLGVIYTALHPRQVRNLVALTVPLEMSATPTLVPTWLSAQTVELITTLYGNCPAWISSALTSARLMARMARFRAEIRGDKECSQVFDRFLHWIDSDVPMAGQLFREVAIDIFAQNRLVRGELAVGGEPINLRRIVCPLLNVVASFDELVPPRACESLTQLVRSRDKATVVFPSSHLGAAAGLSAHERLWPAVGQWLAVRDSPPQRRLRRSKATAVQEGLSREGLSNGIYEKIEIPQVRHTIHREEENGRT